MKLMQAIGHYVILPAPKAVGGNLVLWLVAVCPKPCSEALSTPQVPSLAPAFP